MLKNTIRKAAQRATKTAATCQECGATGKVERHHPNYAEPTRYQILCAPCHVKADLRDGTRRTKQTRPCAICGAVFLPSHTKKNVTCGKQCLSELGRRNARKRWAGKLSQTSPVSPLA